MTSGEMQEREKGKEKEKQEAGEGLGDRPRLDIKGNWGNQERRGSGGGQDEGESKLVPSEWVRHVTGQQGQQPGT